MAGEFSGSHSRKGATKHCCAGNCKHDSRYPENLAAGTYFLPFSKPGKLKDGMTQWERNRQNERTEKTKRWLHACGRKNFGIENVKPYTYICSVHFVGGSGPTDQNPDPLLATFTEAEVNKRLKKRKAPTLRQPILKQCKTKTEVNHFERDSDDNEGPVSPLPLADPVEPFQKDASTQYDPPPITFESVSTQTVDQRTLMVDQSCQSESDKLAIAARIDNIILKNEINILRSTSSDDENSNPMDVESILKSETTAKYFIGLTPRHFWDMCEFLGDAKHHLTYWNSKKDSTNENARSTRACCLTLPQQLFITLLRLRRGFNIMTIAHFYSVSESTIRTIFTTWIMFIFHHFKSIAHQFFPERQAFRKFLPKVFRPFKNIRASVDCTEFKCQTPRDYKQQGHMYSSYKSHCTMKCMIAVNPNGAACFVSDLFEGSTTDVDLFERSGILQHVNYKDSFLVDKGFTVQHLLLSKQATIFIPPFLGKREKFTKEEIILTKRIAKARIHVERFNEPLKKFRLIDRIIPLSLAHMASQLVFVGCMLVNFQEFLCK
ncbi:uncharacterized protein [Clytia hemisphaerica]|uniref:uncharacterized protein n=1 Tax=Clytia hemisphaerica TaxID=252671 RepID=UPI0034D5C2A4